MHSDVVGPVLKGNIFQAKNAFAAFEPTAAVHASHFGIIANVRCFYADDIVPSIAVRTAKRISL